MNTQPYGEIFQTVVPSTKFDSKNRQIGYIIVFRDNGTDFIKSKVFDLNPIIDKKVQPQNKVAQYLDLISNDLN